LSGSLTKAPALPGDIYCVDQNVPLLALDLLARIAAMRIDIGPPFSALFTL
jgi:hypothetical protein